MPTASIPAAIGSLISSLGVAAPAAAAAAPAAADLAVTLPEVSVLAAAPEVAAAAAPAAVDLGGAAIASGLAGAETALPAVLGGGGAAGAAPNIAATIPSIAPTTTPASTPISPSPTLPSVMTPAGQSAAPGAGASATAAPSSVALDPLATGGTTVTDAVPEGINAGPGSQLASATTTGTTSTTGAGATLPTVTGGGTGNSGLLPVGQLSGDQIQGAWDQLAANEAINPTPVAPSSGTGFGSGVGSTIKDVGSWLLKNPGVGIGALGLGYEALTQAKPPSISGADKQLESEASTLAQQGSTLQQYLQTGTLPPGVQAGIDQATAAAKAAIKSKYASMGGGAETSSAAIEDMANVDMTAQTQGAQLALQLLQQGVTESQLSSQLYESLINQSLQSNQALASAIGNFASAAVPKTVITQPAAA